MNTQKYQSITNDSRCLRSELQGTFCSGSKSGSSGSGVRGRIKSSGGGVRFCRLGDAIDIAGIAVRLPIELVKVLRQTAQYVLDRKPDHLLSQEPLPCLAGRRQPCIQVNVDTIAILGSDKAVIPLEGTFGDNYSLTLPNATVHGLGQRSGLNT